MILKGVLRIGLILYLYVSAVWCRCPPVTDPPTPAQLDAFSAEVMQLLDYDLANSPGAPSLFAEWRQIVPRIQQLTFARQRDLARFISGLAFGPSSVDENFEWIAYRLRCIVHSLQSRSSLSGNVAVGIHDTFPLSQSPSEDVCTPAALPPPAASPRKTRSGKSYPAGSLKAVTRIPKEAKRKRALRTPSTRKAQSVPSNASLFSYRRGLNDFSIEPCTTSPITSGKPEASTTWTVINPSERHSSAMTALAPRNSSPHSGRPHVWATVRWPSAVLLHPFDARERLARSCVRLFPNLDWRRTTSYSGTVRHRFCSSTDHHGKMTDGMEAERSNCRCTYGSSASPFVC